MSAPVDSAPHAGRAESAAAVERSVLRRRAAIAEAIADTVIERLPAYRAVDRSSVTQTSARVIEVLVGTLSRRSLLSDDDRATLVEYGARRAEQGVPLDAVSMAWRYAVRHLSDVIVELSIDSDLALTLIRRLSDCVDEATGSVTQGHHTATLERTVRDDRARSAFVIDLISGRLGPVELQRAARGYGIELTRSYRAVRARPGPYLDPAGVLESALNARRCMLTLHEGDVVGFVDILGEPHSEHLMALGPPAPPARLDRSFRLATRMLRTAVAAGCTGVQRFDDLCLLTAVADDTDLGAELVERILTPLGSAESAESLIVTVQTYLDTAMHIDATAERLFCHPNTVRYRIARFQELSGTDLREPRDAFVVWWAIAAYRHF